MLGNELESSRNEEKTSECKNILAFVEKTTKFSLEEIKKILKAGDMTDYRKLTSYIFSFNNTIGEKLDFIKRFGELTNETNSRKRIEEIQKKIEKECDEHEKIIKFRSDKIKLKPEEYFGFIGRCIDNSVQRVLLELICKMNILSKCLDKLIKHYNSIRKDIESMEQDTNNLKKFFENLDKEINSENRQL